MKCAGCEIMFPGVAGLMPRKVRSTLPVAGMAQFDMLCKDCHKEANEAEAKYKHASHGE